MVFSSPLFLSIFLPILLLVYTLAQSRYRNTILLIASFIFYSWGEPRALLIMLGLIVINYYAAIFMKNKKLERIFSKHVILGAALAINLSTLFFYKYLDFAITNTNKLMQPFDIYIELYHITLPIGISFYCFQAMSYIIDVYRNDVDVQYSLPNLALYISLFPQLVAGPIVRYSTICNELEDRTLHFNNLYEGLVRFSIGLAKKIFIADTMGYVAYQIFVADVSTIPQLWAWVGCITYSLQIYYDFSAYSDMAIGLGRIFNFYFLENFNFPYSAASIKEFWRRWHISLSSWLRDYLYIPLGGNRISPARTLVNQFIVFLLCGLWHGAAWNFIAWGIWHGLGLLSEKFTGSYIARLPRILAHAYMLLFVMVGWVIFRAPDLSYAVNYLKIMFMGNISYDMFSFLPAWEHCITISNGLFMLLGMVLSWPISLFSFKTLQNKVTGIVVLVLLFAGAYSFAMTSTFSPFIYFRF